MENKKLKQTYLNIKQRCLNKKNMDYKKYGARGITICQEWKSSYKEFEGWSLENGYKEGLSIDRIDNNKGYSPTNCRWTDRKTQQNNRSNNIKIMIDEEILTLMQVAEKYNIKYITVVKRYHKGITDINLIKQPKHSVTYMGDK